MICYWLLLMDCISHYCYMCTHTPSRSTLRWVHYSKFYFGSCVPATKLVRSTSMHSGARSGHVCSHFRFLSDWPAIFCLIQGDLIFRSTCTWLAVMKCPNIFLFARKSGLN